MRSIKAAIAKASTLEEIERLNQQLRTGQVPGTVPAKKNTAGPKNIFLYLIFFSVFRIRKFSGLPDPDLLVRGTDPDPPIIKQKLEENPWFLLFCDFIMTFYM